VQSKEQKIAPRRHVIILLASIFHSCDAAPFASHVPFAIGKIVGDFLYFLKVRFFA
jgi:hypothetical protein